MSVIADTQQRPEDVGDILLKVHEDLLHLKEQLLSQNASSAGLDLSSIQNALLKTEDGIKKSAEQVLNTINNRVQTLPTLEEQAVGNYGQTAENTWDLQESTGAKDISVRKASGLKDRRRPQKTPNKYSFSPAEKLRLKMAQKAMYNPHNDHNREVMNDQYGIQLPLINDNRRQRPTEQRLILGSTIEPLAALPAANRKDPQLAPPPINEEDARYGIISLLERGLIPPGADLALDPSPVKHKLVPLHSANRKQPQNAIADGSVYNLAGVKLDTSIKVESTHDDSESHGVNRSDDGHQTASHSALRRGGKQKSIHMPKTSITQKTLELQLHPVLPKVQKSETIFEWSQEHLDKGVDSNVPSLPPIVRPSYLDVLEFFNQETPQNLMLGTVVRAVGNPLVGHITPSDDKIVYYIKEQAVPPETAEHSTSVSHQRFKPLFSTPKVFFSHTQQNAHQPPPTTPNVYNGENKAVQHRFPIQHGHARQGTVEYMAFRQHYCLSWGPIVSMLQHMETVMRNYAVPVAFIDGDKLADLALEFELDCKPTIQNLLTAVVNRDDVESLMQRPGQRFRGENGDEKAATLIQSYFRRFKERRAYLDYRHRKWAAGVIALTWVMNVKMATMKRQLAVTRLREMESFREKSKKFAISWNRIKKSRRVIIHIPSLGYSQRIRDTMNDFGTVQNAQMARLCDITDPNVDVIYISPVPINDECLQYYSKLLALRSAIDSGNVDDQADMMDRYKIVIPEAIKSFPTHRMCLSTHLKYSPKALKRIRALINGRDAYIVPGMPHIDDLSVSEFLNVPILCPEPEVAHLYSTKSGSKRVFQSAGVRVPPGEYDIYTFPQLHDALAQLITDNLDVRTWLFKMDEEFDGRGTAYCHVADHLRCYMWAKKECERYGEDKWSKKWAQEPAFTKIHSELPGILENHATPVNKSVYTSWAHFLAAFLSRGGIVEATPPSDSITNITVDLLIEPDGKISTLSSGDQIHADSPYRCWGLSTPQCSTEPDDMNKETKRIAEACKARGVVGYFAIDLLTFINPKSGEQEIWATDLNLHYNDSTAMNSLARFMSNGTFSLKDHMFNIPQPVVEKKRRRRRHQSEENELPPTTNRYAVYSTKLLHSNLTVVHYSVFFQMCRAHGIGYDVKEKQGTVFTLIDSFNRENLGMLTVGDNLQGALATFARNLSCIHQEISAPNMQGVTNFKHAIEDIEAILGTTIQNANDQETVDAEER